MDDEDRPLDEFAGAVLDGQAVDWAVAEASAAGTDREALQQLKVLAGIAELHRSLARDPLVSDSCTIPEEKLEHWGRLEILERIGRGSFGEVYRARDPKLDREVAVKLLHGGKEQPEGATVLREARLLARVRHPNVVTVYDADEIEGRVGLWMEFIHGRNLEQVLGERGKFDDREVTRIGIEVCRALSAVHDAGLLHRDIKAQNLMQTGDGRLVLMDFGTGRELEETPGSSLDAAGTPLYLAPEIFQGAQATVRTDIYSTGVLLFHLLTGAYPVRGATVKEVAEAHARGERLDLAEGAPAAKKALAAVIGRAIEHDSPKRFESARGMLAALENLQRRTEKPRRAALIAAGFGLAILVVGAVAWLSRTGSSPSAGTLQALPFQPRDWILVAGFENRTGDSLFDGTLDYALGLELSNSRHVNVVPRERVADALRLMRKPPDSSIDAGLAREVCLRDGGIRALLTGRVEKLGSNYLLSVELVDPKQGSTLAGFREESAGADGTLAAIGRISDRLRVALGDTADRGDPDATGLARVTTTNLRALQLYSRADLLMQPGHLRDSQPVAEELLRQAVAEDPSFASAWIHLAWTLRNQGKPLEEFQPYAETALRLADETSERERYFIRGSYYALLGQKDKAITAYEALLDLYPDHLWAAWNLVNLYDWAHDPRALGKSAAMEARLADLHPKNFFWNWNAGYDFVVFVPDRAQAGSYLDRAAELVTPGVTEDFPSFVSWLDLLPFTEDWLKGDLAAASSDIDRVAAKVDSLNGPARDRFGLATALGYMTLGQLQKASRMAQQMADPVARNDMLAQISFNKGDTHALDRHLRFVGARRSEGGFPLTWRETTSILQARAGLTSEARRFLQPQENSAELHTVRGELALARKDLPGAVLELEDAMRLQEGLKLDDRGARPGFYLGSESLADALAQGGDVPQAIRILEESSDRRYAVIRGNTAAYWLRNRLKLATLYRRVGREADAQIVEEELSKLLALADSDHPIRLELQHRSAS